MRRNCWRGCATCRGCRWKASLPTSPLRTRLDKSYAELQFARFAELLAQLAAGGLRPPVAHAANSAALLTMPHTHLDLVRSGIALYGLDPDMDQCRLPPGFQPALSWKAVVTQVADLEPGEPVSYGREYTAAAPMRVAVIPVGYADGFPRKPRTWGSVLIRGRAAPILGRVCMDQTIVDVTAIEAETGTPTAGKAKRLSSSAAKGRRRSAQKPPASGSAPTTTTSSAASWPVCPASISIELGKQKRGRTRKE